jgi:hypothetical protein
LQETPGTHCKKTPLLQETPGTHCKKAVVKIPRAGWKNTTVWKYIVAKKTPVPEKKKSRKSSGVQDIQSSPDSFGTCSLRSAKVPWQSVRP